MITDKLTGKGKGFGFIEMPNEEEAKNAIEDLNGAEVDGKPIVVNKSIEKKDDNKRSNFSNANKKSDFSNGGFNKSGGYNKGGYNKGGAGGASKGGSKKGSSRRASY